MAQHNDDKVAVVPGQDLNDGVLTFYLANGATTINQVDAANEFLLARGITGDKHKNDMWREFLLGIASLSLSGTTHDMKAAWWAAGAPLT